MNNVKYYKYEGLLYGPNKFRGTFGVLYYRTDEDHMKWYQYSKDRKYWYRCPPLDLDINNFIPIEEKEVFMALL